MRRESALALLVTTALACGGRVLETTATEVLGTPAEDGGGADAMMGSDVDSSSAPSSSSGGDDANPATESGSGEGAEAGFGDDGGGSDGLAPPDAVAPPSCTLSDQGGSSGGTVMEHTWVETCSDGHTYTVGCECPAALCCCNGINCPPELGGGDGGVPYPACNGGDLFTDAGESAAWAACGYPQPN